MPSASACSNAATIARARSRSRSVGAKPVVDDRDLIRVDARLAPEAERARERTVVAQARRCPGYRPIPGRWAAAALRRPTRGRCSTGRAATRGRLASARGAGRGRGRRRRASSRRQGSPQRVSGARRRPTAVSTMATTATPSSPAAAAASGVAFGRTMPSRPIAAIASTSPANHSVSVPLTRTRRSTPSRRGRMQCCRDLARSRLLARQDCVLEVGDDRVGARVDRSCELAFVTRGGEEERACGRERWAGV